MGRNKDELIKLAEKITGQECKDVLTKKDALQKIACHYLGEEKEFASIADCLESIVEYGTTGGSGGGNTYAHKVEIKFDNFSLSYYGQESNYEIFSISFRDIAGNSTGNNDISVSGDLQELLNFYPFMLSPNSESPLFTKESKIACHIYLKDADTENLVKGVGIYGSSSEGSREVGILFNKGTQDKFFTNTIVLEWN